MDEGWRNDDYLILFAEEETSVASDRHGLTEALPGFQLLGLRGWDDFIVRDRTGRVFTIPTVPCDLQYLEPFHLPPPGSKLETDERRLGKIKWYKKPIAFGGDAGPGDNLTWVDHDQHAYLVRYGGVPSA